MHSRFRIAGPPWLVCGAAVGYGAASGVYGKDLPTKAYPQGTSRRQDAAGGVDGGPEHADRNADRPRFKLARGIGMVGQAGVREPSPRFAPQGSFRRGGDFSTDEQWMTASLLVDSDPPG